MRIHSFNINGIRARYHQLEALTKKTWDIVGFQEIKVDSSQFPTQDVIDTGLPHVEHFGQKGYHGVASAAKKPFTVLQKGFAEDNAEAQRRLIITEHQLSNEETLIVVNGYFPQGDNQKHETKYPAKRDFYQHLMNWLDTRSPNENIVVLGDFNISQTDLDIGIGDVNAKRWLKTGKCSFLPEEREWFKKLYDWGLKDSYRMVHPEKDDAFSWFDYRSKGFPDNRGLRIDGLLVSPGLADKVVDAGIDYDIRGMEKPSDHAPIWVELSLDLA